MTARCPEPTADVRFAGDRLLATFRPPYGLADYPLFLKCKALPESAVSYDWQADSYTVDAPARFAPMLGVEVPQACAQDLPLFGASLPGRGPMDDQVAVAEIILDAKRFAYWGGCGVGKTYVGLEVARQVAHRTGQRVLVTTKNEIVGEWLDQAQHFYGDGLSLHRIGSRQQMREWMTGAGPGPIGITNYEKWNPEDLEHQVVSEARHLGGVILDEADMLRNSGGKQKWALIKSCRGIEYKLLLTATPAPNDTMEFASQASFLEKMRSEGEIIWTFFARDPKSHRWRVKPAAREAFFRFMASWSIYVNDPRRYGWRQGMPDVPEPIILRHELAILPEQREWLGNFAVDPDGQRQLPGVNDRDTNAIQRLKLSQAAKGFCYRKGQQGKYDRIPSLKPAFVADLLRQDLRAGLQGLVWTEFDAETELLVEALGDCKDVAVLTGKTQPARRLEILDGFRRGQIPWLLSRASLLGYGMNFQHVGSMIYSGWTDSFVRFYQSLRRAFRHGQTRRLRVHIPVIPELEGDQLDNIERKQGEHERSVAEMERNYIRARREMEGRHA